MASTDPEKETTNTFFDLTITHHGTAHSFCFDPSSTIIDLSNHIHTTLSIAPNYQKFLISPKTGLLKPPFSDPTLLLSALRNKTIKLLAPTPSELSSLARSSAQASPSRPQGSSTLKPALPSRTRDWRKIQEEATYTFATLIPLPYLPHSERSLRFLERLRADPGIKAAMRAHKFSVGTLTEMNPAEHTTHESRTLGLNRNRGEVIELRLRTDAYDGYRDYKVIRKTLCHELAHNVFGEHDRDFWDLTGKIEKEVEAGDWKSGGHALTSEEFYNPADKGLEGGHVDGGGWTGGEYVLGGTEERTGGSAKQGLTRRELLAKAAEERLKREKDVGKGGGKMV